MADSEGGQGFANLAKVMNRRNREESENLRKEFANDFGVINQDWSLTVNSFSKPFPKGEYRICRSISGIIISGVEHGHKIPQLQIGDHVLVCWVDKEPVVIDVLVSSAVL